MNIKSHVETMDALVAELNKSDINQHIEYTVWYSHNDGSWKWDSERTI